jgi:tripartite-type tricarboxylate transporter receptor subunit TctC
LPEVAALAEVAIFWPAHKNGSREFTVTTRRTFIQLAGGGAFAAASGLVTSTHAQTAWPNKAVTIINPFPPGGGNDVFARPLGAELTKQIGQTFLVDNRAGAGGTVGAGIAARSAPDGYTLFTGAIHHTIAPSIYPSLTYNLEKDMAPLAVMAVVPQVIVVNPQKVKARTLAEFIAEVKANPGKFNYGSAGNGTSHHLAGELFKLQTGTQIAHVPYKGAGPAMQDLMAGVIDVIFDGLATSASQIKAGRIIPLAVATPARVESLPDVPTTAESGLPGYEVTTWYGMWAIAGTPQPIIDRLVTEIDKALATDALKTSWANQGAKVGTTKPAEMAKFITSETSRWAKVVKDAGIKLE